MHEKLRQHIDELFQDAPQTVKVVELKEEILQNVSDKYDDMIAEGKTEDAAYRIAVAGIGDVGELIRGVAPVEEQDRKRTTIRAIMEAVAIALYVLCVTPILILQNEFSIVLMFLIIAVATGILIYLGATKNRYVRSDDTMVEEFKEWKQNGGQDQQARKAILGAMWLLAVCIYFLLSAFTHAWYITWLVFPIAAGVGMVIHGVFDLKAADERK